MPTIVSLGEGFFSAPGRSAQGARRARTGGPAERSAALRVRLSRSMMVDGQAGARVARRSRSAVTPIMRTTCHPLMLAEGIGLFDARRRPPL